MVSRHPNIITKGWLQVQIQRKVATHFTFKEVQYKMGMTTEQVLQLDCRKQENEQIIQRVLKQIKPLSKYTDVETIPFWAVEKAINVMSKKYNIRVREFMPDVWSNNKQTIWRAIIVNEHDLTTKTVYGIDLYEVFTKVAIYMYSLVKKGIVEVREV